MKKEEHMIRHQTLAVFGFVVLGSFVSMRVSAQDSPVDRALSAARQVDGTSNVSIEILENDQSGEYDCHGRNARVMGNGNNVSFRNCCTVSVPENEHTVNVYDARLIKVYGSSNTFYWAGDKKPETTILGSHNQIRQITERRQPQEGGGSPARDIKTGPPIVIDQVTQRSYDMDCDGRDVNIKIAGVSVVLHGDCGTILIEGAANRVTFDRAQRLQVTGTDNTVRWLQRPTTVSNSGLYNSLGAQSK
jgi:hypothetical protein